MIINKLNYKDMDKSNVWLITAKTNLHVGNENTSSYGLIDLAIQRSVLTGLPCINSSSLKGALNEYASQSAQLSDVERIKIFGVDKLDKSKSTQKGGYTFFDANILFLPVQDDNNLYKLVTCESVVKRCIEQAQLFGITINEQDLSVTKENTINNDTFKDLCSDDNLPIIARNKLENGESKNLWYEQVLPAETVLYTFIDSKKETALNEAIKNQIVQIGANATIGYGYCKFTNLK